MGDSTFPQSGGYDFVDSPGPKITRAVFRVKLRSVRTRISGRASALSAKALRGMVFAGKFWQFGFRSIREQ